MSPLSTSVVAGGTVYMAPFVGPYLDWTLPVDIDVNDFSAIIDADGYLAPGIGIQKDGMPFGTAPVHRQNVLAGGVAGNHTLTGIAPGDRILSVLHNTAGVLVDITSEFTIDSANTIDNTGGTDTTADELLVVWEDDSARLAGVVPEAIQIADSSAAADLTAAGNKQIALAVFGVMDLVVVEDNLSRVLTEAERNALSESAFITVN